MRVLAPGVKPFVEERCTSYAETPTLSVEALQVRLVLEPLTPAVTPRGEVGAAASVPLLFVALTCAAARDPFSAVGYTANSSIEPLKYLVDGSEGKPVILSPPIRQ